MTEPKQQEHPNCQWVQTVITSFFLELILCWKICSEVAEVVTICIFPSYGSDIVLVSALKNSLCNFSLFGWLVADGWCLRVLLAGCWWLVCCERKILLAGG
jgi:hypothetical protein